MLTKLDAFEEDAQFPDPRFPVKHVLARGGMDCNNPPYIHWHEALEILHVYRGVLFVRVGSSSTFLHPGDALLIGSGYPHVITFPQPQPAIYSVYLFQPQMVSTAWGDTYQTEFIGPTLAKEQFIKAHVGLVSRGASNANAAAYLGQLRKELQDAGPGHRLRVRGFLLLALGDLYERYQGQVASGAGEEGNLASSTPHPEMDRMQPVFDYVRTHFGKPVTLDDVAKVVNMSKYHFCREFQRVTGHSFSRYLRDVRLTHAIHQLRHTDRNVTQIASECGFRSISAFYSMFKQMLSCTPGRIRKE